MLEIKNEKFYGKLMLFILEDVYFEIEKRAFNVEDKLFKGKVLQ